MRHYVQPANTSTCSRGTLTGKARVAASDAFLLMQIRTCHNQFDCHVERSTPLSYAYHKVVVVDSAQKVRAPSRIGFLKVIASLSVNTHSSRSINPRCQRVYSAQVVRQLNVSETNFFMLHRVFRLYGSSQLDEYAKLEDRLHLDICHEIRLNDITHMCQNDNCFFRACRS